MEIKVLGGCCDSCDILYENVKKVIAELGITADVEKVRDPVKVASYGVISTPGLVVDGTVVSYGRKLDQVQVRKLFEKLV